MPGFGGFGPAEMIFVLLIVLLVFGAKRLPEIGSSLGKGIREFKRSVTDIKSEIDRPEDRHERHEIRSGSQTPASVAPDKAARPVEEQRNETS